MIKLYTVYQKLKPELNQFEKSLDKLFAKQDGVGRRLYLEQAKFKGKRLRPALLFLSALATGKIKRIHSDLALIVELIHNATLIHDDVLDDATARRYLPTINQRWGNETAILFGDLIFSNAFQTCARTKSTEVLKILSATANQMCYGELTHTARKFDPALTEKEYLKIIEDKTASLFSLACYLGGLFATGNKRHHTALKNYGINFGMAYQIIDDYLDCTSNEKLLGKTAGTDLVKGKITLPFIRLKQILPARKRKVFNKFIALSRRKQINAVLRNSEAATERRRIGGRLTDYQKEINSLLQEHKIDKYVLESASRYLDKAKKSLVSLPDSPGRKLLGIMADAISP